MQFGMVVSSSQGSIGLQFGMVVSSSQGSIGRPGACQDAGEADPRLAAWPWETSGQASEG